VIRFREDEEHRMSVRVKKLPPALKHGAYSASGILPGEDPAAFKKLHHKLIAELRPIGALEDDIVGTIARLLWRKQNLATFRVAELARARVSTIERQNRPPEPPPPPDYLVDFIPKEIDPAETRSSNASCKGSSPERAGRRIPVS
jgi:hypothetical protein